MSPEGIMELLNKDTSARNHDLHEMSYDLLRDKDGLNLREYQIRAIEAAEEAIINGQLNILLAMATGTGKTRTVLGMIYRFLKTKRFRRILFLVDRTSLGEQAFDVFKEVKLEDLMTLDEIYNVKGLEDKDIDRETRIQIATVQSINEFCTMMKKLCPPFPTMIWLSLTKRIEGIFWIKKWAMMRSFTGIRWITRANTVALWNILTL